jgi:colanic acid biosynthesis glycosyl transferase WcaI
LSNPNHKANQEKKVLVVTPQYAPDFGPSAPIYTWLCEDLQQMGCDVTVVTGFPHYAGSDAKYKYPGKFFSEGMLNGVRVIRTYIYSVQQSALWKRLLYHASFNIFSTLATLRVGRPDIVLADAPTLWSGLSLLVKSIIPRVPFVYIVHDIYPDVLFRLGALKSPHLINMIERVENFYYERAAQISVLSDGFKENLFQKGVPESKQTIIPACVDIEFIRPLPRENELREQWGMADKFVVLYAGNIGYSQGLETTLEAAKILLDFPKIEFLIVGEGAMKKELQTLAERGSLTNVRFIPFQLREKVPMIYATADICLVSLKRDIVVESVPSKTYSIMASGRPVIATIDFSSEIGRLLNEAQCGLCVEPENPQALADGILKLYHDGILRIEMGKRGRDFVVEKYSRHVAAMQYYSLIQRFSKGKA